MQPMKQHILFPCDFSSFATKAWTTVENVAYAYNAEVVLLYVVEPHTVDFIEEEETLAARKYVNEQLEKWDNIRNIPMQVVIKVGKVYKKVSETALELDPVMIIMGTHGASGFEEYFIGSNASKTIRTSPCPVITVKDGTNADGINKVLLPLDFTLDAQIKLHKTIEVVKKLNATLYLITVENPNNDAKMEGALKHQLDNFAKYAESAGVLQVESVLLVQNEKSVQENIIEYAQEMNIDLICIMPEKVSYLKMYLLGADEEHFVNHSPIPVLTFPPANQYVAKKAGSIFG